MSSHESLTSSTATASSPCCPPMYSEGRSTPSGRRRPLRCEGGPMWSAIQALPVVFLAFQCDFSSWRESNALIADAFTPVVARGNARFAAFCPKGSNLLPTSTQLFASKIDEIGGISRSPRLSSVALEQQRTLLSPEEEHILLQRTSDYQAVRTVKNDMETRLSRRVKASELAGELSPPMSTSELTRTLERGQAAREELISRNMGLVHHVASKYASGGSSAAAKSSSQLQSLSYDDLVQEGVIGMTRAIDRYDLRRAGSNRFSTYAVYWIRASILRAISSHDELIRVPEHVTASIRKVQGAARRLGLDDMDIYADGAGAAWRTDSTEGALAVEAGLTRSQLREALAVASRRGAAGRSGVVELQPWMRDASSPASAAAGASSAVANGQRPDGSDDSNVREVLARFLRPKEVQAIALRYGLSLESDDATSSSSARATETRRPFRDYEAEAESELFPSSGSSSATAEQLQGRILASNDEQPEGPKRGRWGEAMTFKEVGKRMAISAEYGRRLCSAALEKLRVAARDGRLEPEFLMP